MIRLFKLKILSSALGVLVVFLFAASALATDTKDLGDPGGLVRWRADTLDFDRDENQVRAKGKVEIHYEGMTLHADEVVYRRDEDLITAAGNIKMIDRAGNVSYAKNLELTGDLKVGFVESVRILFEGGERLAAERGERKSGRFNILNRVIYTACKVCDEHPDEEPLWLIKASKVTHDEVKKTLTYRNAVLELFDVPIFYTPWLQHPDASVKRASGFMTPDFGSSSLLGLTMAIPYFWNIKPNMDATFTPIVTTDERAIMSAEFRHRTRPGTYQFSGSGTYVQQRDDSNALTGREEFRGHIFGNGQFDITESWRWGFEVAAASDDTYLRRYDISKADSLTSRVYVEQIDRRSYFVANTYVFQGLRAEDVGGETPIAAPYVRYNFVGRPGWLGGQMSADASLLTLIRSDGMDTGRGSLGAKWELPYTSQFGELYKLTVGLRGDLYFTDRFEVPDENGLSTDNDFRGRAIPYIAMDWRLPFVRQRKYSRQIIEPIVVMVASPHGVNSSRIPNEDSISFDLDVTNLFAIDRYTGLDLWEGGMRAAYGLRMAHYTDGGTVISLLVGQSYRLREDENFPADSSLRNNFSDVVVAASLSVPGWFDYVHRMRFDKETLKVRRNEATLSFGPSDYRFYVGYVDVKRDSFDVSLPNRTEIWTRAALRLSRYWSAEADFSLDFEPGGGVLTTGGGFVYEDECFRFRISARRDFTSDRDARPETTVGFQLVFKVVGQGVQP